MHCGHLRGSFSLVLPWAYSPRFYCSLQQPGKTRSFPLSNDYMKALRTLQSRYINRYPLTRAFNVCLWKFNLYRLSTFTWLLRNLVWEFITYLFILLIISISVSSIIKWVFVIESFWIKHWRFNFVTQGRKSLNDLLMLESIPTNIFQISGRCSIVRIRAIIYSRGKT